MPNAHLSRVSGVEPSVAQALQGSNLSSTRDVLLLNVVDLMELLNITHSQALQLQQAVSACVCPAFTTALEIARQPRVLLSTALPTLDASLRGGVPASGITELVGPAGIGKSQMCFQLALLCAAPSEVGGLEAATMYVDTEHKFSPQRFAEMARSRFTTVFGAGIAGGGAMLDATMSRVLLISPTNTEQLLRCLEMLEAGVIEHSARLVIVDSVAALARAEFGGGGSGSIVERQEMLGSVASRLKQLAEAFRIPVVVTNQVTTRMAGPTAAHAFQQPSAVGGGSEGGGYTTAALGTKWAHCINVRLVLERLEDRRFIKVAKSPASGNSVLEYCVGPTGVEEVQGADLPETLGNRNVHMMSIANEAEYYGGASNFL